MTSTLNAAQTLTVHYSRLGGYDGWKLWVWNDSDHKPGFDVAVSRFDSFGAVFELDLQEARLSGKRTGLLPRRGEWLEKDSPDRFLEAAAPAEIFLLEGDGTVHAAPPEVSTSVTGAWFDGAGIVRAGFNRPVDAAFLAGQEFSLVSGEKLTQALSERTAGDAAYSRTGLLSFNIPENFDLAPINEGKYELRSRSMKPATLRLGDVMYAKKFYSAKPLGAVTGGGVTVIRIFSPKASAAEALIYDEAGGAPRAWALAHKGGGIWEKDFGKSLEGKYYRLRVRQGGKTYEGNDPYATCVSGDNGPALIHKDNTPVAPGPVFGLSETVLYEVHLRDLTMDEFSGVKNKGKYLGAAETGTAHPRFPEIKTGLDHIAELGVNAVHILPFQDFENGDSTTAYNWGYMPVNFNSPEGSYATSPRGGARVAETKLMIDAFHRKGLKVIMDVVYNHTAETRDAVYNFNAMAMDYYYRVNPDGGYSNGSGCGNEFNTEAPMARRFLIDSLLHWVREYKADGFRFDLMGLMDLDAVKEMLKALRAEKPDIMIYGEPWAAGATPTRGVSKGAQRSGGFSVFNDNFRDALKGSVFHIEDLGYVQAAKNREAVMRGIRGAVDEFTDGPLETLNYVSCHDNNTLWDRIDLSVKDELYANKVKMNKLANAVVLTSQGIPFLHAGVEFLRTKNGEENSYNLSDEINRLDWTRKKENFAVFSYYRDLIALRKAHPAFRMNTAAEVRGNLKFYDELDLKVEPPAIAYVLYGDKAGDSWSRIAVLINPTKKTMKFALPEGEWRIGFNEKGLYSGRDLKYSKQIGVPPLSLLVVHK